MKSIQKSKPKPSLLDKPSAKQSKDTSKENTPSPPSSPSPAQNSAQNQAMSSKLEEFASELQKMKAIILKHEVRIRELEKRGHGLDNTQNSNSQASSEANNNGDNNLLPDEV